MIEKERISKGRGRERERKVDGIERQKEVGEGYLYGKVITQLSIFY